MNMAFDRKHSVAIKNSILKTENRISVVPIHLFEKFNTKKIQTSYMDTKNYLPDTTLTYKI